MNKNELDSIIQRVAHINNVPPEDVRREMQKSMEYAMKNPDPAIQAKWDRIPKKGNTVTLEEFIEYVAQIVSS